MHIAVIGAGISGLTAAWLLDEHHDITVYEATDHLGGNIRTVRVPTGHGTAEVDLGAQFLSPVAYPHHTALCRALGITFDDALQVPLTTTLLRAGQDEPVLVTPHTPTDASIGRKPLTGPAWEALGGFLGLAAQLEAADSPDTATVAELAAPLQLPQPLFEDAVLAWCASFIGCTLAQAARMPARAAASWATRTPPEQPDASPLWHLLTPGLGTLVHRLASALPERIHCKAPIKRVENTARGPVIYRGDGTESTYDAVVLALPANQAARLLEGSPELNTQAAALASVSYIPTTVALHRDACHMPADRSHWSSVCVTTDGRWSEMTCWLGPVVGADIFKSWITHRTPPNDVIARADFQQLCPTVPGQHAAHLLRTHQGQHGVYYVGSYLGDADSQEGAVRSARDVAATLSPSGSRLDALTL